VLTSSEETRRKEGQNLQSSVPAFRDPNTAPKNKCGKRGVIIYLWGSSEKRKKKKILGAGPSKSQKQTIINLLRKAEGYQIQRNTGNGPSRMVLEVPGTPPTWIPASGQGALCAGSRQKKKVHPQDLQVLECDTPEPSFYTQGNGQLMLVLV